VDAHSCGKNERGGIEDESMNILIVAGSRGSMSQLRPEHESFIGIANKGHDVTIVIEPDSVYTPRLKELGIRLLHCWPTKKICRKTIRTLRKELSSLHYDIIYATSSKTIPNAAFAAIGFPAKVIAYRGTTGGLYRHDPSAYLTILHPRVDGVICVSEAVRQDVLKRVWNNRDKVVTIHKGHDLGWYQASPADLSEFGIVPGDFVIICAVNARPSKGIEVMLDAANTLAAHDNIHLLLAGLNMDKEPYTSLIAGNKMRGRIHTAGFRQDAPELIAASDVLVQPSISGEGLPRAVMEAISYGTPVVATDTGGGKEVIEDGVTGFIVPVREPQAIADRVEKLYASPEFAQQMAKQSRRHLETDFSSTGTVEKFIDFFESLLDRNSG